LNATPLIDQWAIVFPVAATVPLEIIELVILVNSTVSELLAPRIVAVTPPIVGGVNEKSSELSNAAPPRTNSTDCAVENVPETAFAVGPPEGWFAPGTSTSTTGDEVEYSTTLYRPQFAVAVAQFTVITKVGFARVDRHQKNCPCNPTI